MKEAGTAAVSILLSTLLKRKYGSLEWLAKTWFLLPLWAWNYAEKLIHNLKSVVSKET